MTSWNRLRSYPQTKQCFCGSPEIARRCCLLVQPYELPQALANSIDEHWLDIIAGLYHVKDGKVFRSAAKKPRGHLCRSVYSKRSK